MCNNSNIHIGTEQNYSTPKRLYKYPLWKKNIYEMYMYTYTMCVCVYMDTCSVKAECIVIHSSGRSYCFIGAFFFQMCTLYFPSMDIVQCNAVETDADALSNTMCIALCFIRYGCCNVATEQLSEHLYIRYH